MLYVVLAIGRVALQAYAISNCNSKKKYLQH